MPTKKKKRVAKPAKRDKHAVHYSSESTEWETPDWLFQELHKEFAFQFDVCATKKNSKLGSAFCSKEQNALIRPWDKLTCWMNPPYGRGVTGLWVKKAYEESLAGATVVCLLPARTDTKWFHEYCLDLAEIRFLAGRLKFVGAPFSAPFPSMVVIFRPKSVAEEIAEVIDGAPISPEMP